MIFVFITFEQIFSKNKILVTKVWKGKLGGFKIFLGKNFGGRLGPELG